MKALYSLAIVLISFSGNAQDKTLPYYEIPAYPEIYTAGGMASRMVDGLGFRFYWATEGLRESDLAFKPNADARSSEETIEHIYEMSILLLNSTTQTINVPGQNVKLPFAAMRKQTLENFKHASERLRNTTDKELNDFNLIFKRGDKSMEYPFWHQLNGPMADCIWHVGQLVLLRRSSGNPFNEMVNVFMGTAPK